MNFDKVLGLRKTKTGLACDDIFDNKLSRFNKVYVSMSETYKQQTHAHKHTGP